MFLDYVEHIPSEGSSFSLYYREFYCEVYSGTDKRIKVTDIMQKEHGSQVRCEYKIKDVLAGQS